MVKGMLDDFNIVHAVGDDGKQWQENGHGYVPQTYFYDSDGNPIVSAIGPNDKYAHFFGDERSLAGQMTKVRRRQQRKRHCTVAFFEACLEPLACRRSENCCPRPQLL